MYLQITTKCNMKCVHCCYSCTMKGKHMGYPSTFLAALEFCRSRDNCIISLGGGEPTMHPRFFDILRFLIRDFDYVWMATNGSKTRTMFRLLDIIDGNDYENYTCSCKTDEEKEECNCADYFRAIDGTAKLTVALSQDCFHDPIDPRVVERWKNRASRHGHSGCEIRDVSRKVVQQGRAKKTGLGWEEGCVCSDNIIRPDGSIKMCGCPGSPVIGDVYSGIDSKWDSVLNADEYRDCMCYKGAKKLIKSIR